MDCRFIPGNGVAGLRRIEKKVIELDYIAESKYKEYESKINSGDLVSIAEVVRDLHRKDDQPEQSYSERQIYESALGRLAREIAAVEDTDEDSAITKLKDVMLAA